MFLGIVLATVKAELLKDYIKRRKKEEPKVKMYLLADELGVSPQLLSWHMKSNSEPLVVVRGGKIQLYSVSRSV